MKPETAKISSLDDYVKLINILDRKFDYQQRDDAPLILCRGQEVSNWDLLPKLGRNEFLSSDILNKEKLIFEEFRRLSHPHLNFNSKYNEWDLLALAQHYRLPTRLLDWTENPLAALWFSIYKEKDDNSDRVVWILLVMKDEIVNPNEGSPFDQSKTIIFKPNHITKRITAQNGWFTVHKFIDDKKFLPLNLDETFDRRIFKLIISEDLRYDLMRQLNKLNINHFSLFPDLEGLGYYLGWKYFMK